MNTPAFLRSARSIVPAVLLCGAAGCAQTFDAATLGLDASMSAPVSVQVQGEEFKVSKKAVFLLAGIVPASRPSLQKVLAAQMTGDARVADLKISVRSRFADVLITILTVGIVVPRTVTYEGVVVGR